MTSPGFITRVHLTRLGEAVPSTWQPTPHDLSIAGGIAVATALSRRVEFPRDNGWLLAETVSAEVAKKSGEPRHAAYFTDNGVIIHRQQGEVAESVALTPPQCELHSGIAKPELQKRLGELSLNEVGESLIQLTAGFVPEVPSSLDPSDLPV